MSQEKKLSPYRVMTSILTNYQPSLEEKLSINSFFLCRWLSNSTKAIHISNIINRYYKEIPVNIQYDFVKDTLHKDGVKYIKYAKKEEEPIKTIQNISKFYNITLDNAKQYYALMDDKEKYKFEHIYDGMED